VSEVELVSNASVPSIPLKKGLDPSLKLNALYPRSLNPQVMWDHGAGWPGFGGDARCGDTEHCHGLLSLAELEEGIQAGLAAVRHTSPPSQQTPFTQAPKAPSIPPWLWLLARTLVFSLCLVYGSLGMRGGETRLMEFSPVA
jgi:hypothetical protein